MVPLYKLVWERFGFDVKKSQTKYTFTEREGDVFRKWFIKFKGIVEDDLPWRFEPHQKVLQVNAGETALGFFKAYNDSDKPIVGLSIYQVDPSEASIFFHKVQCFWFENQLLHSKEYVDLPVFFYLDPLINRDPSLKDVKELTVTYHFFPASDQSIAEVVQRELEKHEKEQEELKRKKAEFKRLGIEVDESEKEDQFAALPAFSPKRRSERALRQIKKYQEENQDEDADEIEVEIETEVEDDKTVLDDGALSPDIFMKTFKDVKNLNTDAKLQSE